MKKIVLGLSVLALALSLSACEDLKMAQEAFKQEKSGESSGDSGNNPLDAFKKDIILRSALAIMIWSRYRAIWIRPMQEASSLIWMSR